MKKYLVVFLAIFLLGIFTASAAADGASLTSPPAGEVEEFQLIGRVLNNVPTSDWEWEMYLLSPVGGRTGRSSKPIGILGPPPTMPDESGWTRHKICTPNVPSGTGGRTGRC